MIEASRKKIFPLHFLLSDNKWDHVLHLSMQSVCIMLHFERESAGKAVTDVT